MVRTRFGQFGHDNEVHAMKDHMKIYISGKITGLSVLDAEHNFSAAEQAIRKCGHDTVNPMMISPWNLSWDTYMMIAKAIVLDPSVDALYMLRNWKESKGAIIEWELAMQIGKPVYYQNLEDWEQYTWKGGERQ